MDTLLIWTVLVVPTVSVVMGLTVWVDASQPRKRRPAPHITFSFSMHAQFIIHGEEHFRKFPIKWSIKMVIILIDWVRFRQLGKHFQLALSHGYGIQTERSKVCTPRPWAKCFPIRPSHSIYKCTVSHNTNLFIILCTAWNGMMRTSWNCWWCPVVTLETHGIKASLTVQ